MRRYTLIAGVLVCGCVTTESAQRVEPAVQADLGGVLVLVDGTPVGRAELVIRCGKIQRAVTTDDQGRFRATAVPEGRCSVESEAAGLREEVHVGANVLRPGSGVRIVVPPIHRVELEVRSPHLDGTVLLDETLPYAITELGLQLKGRQLMVKDHRLAPLAKLAVGQEFQHQQIKLKVKTIEARRWMPLALRGTPRGLELLTVPFLHGAQVVRLTLATRNVVAMARCEGLREDLLDDLESMAGTYGASGLRVAAILTESCPKAAEWIGRRSYPLLLGGAEALWALQARVGELLVVDGDGRAVWRRPLQAVAPLEQAITHLDRTWPPFAAVRRVSLSRASTVKAAETERLLSQAEAAIKSGKHKEAHALLDQVLQLSPDLAEARKQRALTKARLGDLSGAMREVTWWRTSFGPESADDLLDEVQRCSKVTTLR